MTMLSKKIFSNIPFQIRLINRFSPQTLLKKYSKLCAKSGMQSSKLILSFDCDTDEDIKVVWDVHSRLIDMGVLPVYAVPGKLLERGEKVYGKILETGAEFINHGGREHTYFDQEKSRHASCFFYDQQSNQDVHEDIYKGHETLQRVLGVKANGWRTPHFGTYQEKEHLTFLYQTLADLNYSFSTSTSPLQGYLQGPAFNTDNITEIPVTGMFTHPLNILDSWAFFEAPDRTRTSMDYRDECVSIAAFMENNPLLINLYADPSHIYNDSEFFEGIKALSQNAQSTNYTKFLKDL